MESTKNTINYGMQNGLRDLIVEKFGGIKACEKEFARVTGIKLNPTNLNNWLMLSKPKEANRNDYEELMKFLHYKLDVRFPDGLFISAVAKDGAPLYAWSDGMMKLRESVKELGGYENIAQTVNAIYGTDCNHATVRRWVELNAEPVANNDKNYRSTIAYLEQCGCEFPDGTFGSVIVPDKLTPPANEPIAPKCDKPSGMLFLDLEETPVKESRATELISVIINAVTELKTLI